MGGFLYVAHQPSETAPQIADRYRSSLQALKDKRLLLKEVVCKSGFTLFLFEKANLFADNFLSMPNGDFVCVTGTFIYRQQTGAKALQNLYDHFSVNADVFNDLRGHFCVFLQKDGELHVFNDYGGLYHVFSDSTGNVLSNSFIAVAKSLPQKTMEPQGLYEYVIFGGMYGDKTFLQEISQLSSTRVYRLGHEPQSFLKRIEVHHIRSKAFKPYVEYVAEELTHYFESLKRNFGDEACMLLSESQDFRLILAAMGKAGMRPKFYAVGKETAANIRATQETAKAENISLIHLDFDNQPQLTPDAYRIILAEQFHFTDGRGNNGAFDNGSAARIRTVMIENTPLHLNNCGREIYDDYWQLPDRDLNVMTFVRTIFEKDCAPLLSSLTEAFRQEEFFGTFGEKIKASLGITSDLLSREMIEAIYPSVQLKYWTGSTNSSDNLLSYSLTPFGEATFSMPSTEIPLSFKHDGEFQTAVLNKLDPKQTLSSFGPTFSGRPQLKDDFKDKARSFLRPLLPRALSTAANPTPNKSVRPYYFASEYLDAIFQQKTFAVSQYIALERIKDNDQLNRALTVELVLQGCL